MSAGYEVREPSPGWNFSYYRGDLLDINVWIALSLKEHPHHAAASLYWQTTLTQYNLENAQNPDQIEAKLHFCRHTALSLVRVLMQATAQLNQPLKLSQAWGVYENFRSLSEVGFVGELRDGQALDQMLTAMITSQNNVNARIWMDLQLAAMAKLYGLRMVTFDADFKRFGLTDLLVIDV